MKRFKIFITWPVYLFEGTAIWIDDHIVKRFQKRRLLKQYTATVRLKPGVTNIRLTVNGEVQADLLLENITYSRGGPTSATFVDRSAFMRDRRIR